MEENFPFCPTLRQIYDTGGLPHPLSWEAQRAVAPAFSGVLQQQGVLDTRCSAPFLLAVLFESVFEVRIFSPLVMAHTLERKSLVPVKKLKKSNTNIRAVLSLLQEETTTKICTEH